MLLRRPTTILAAQAPARPVLASRRAFACRDAFLTAPPAAPARAGRREFPQR